MSEEAPLEEWQIPNEVEEADWKAKRELASAVRELSHVVVSSEGSAETFRELAASVRALTGRLEAEPSRTFRQAYADGAYYERPDFYRDRGVGLGHTNPFSGPLELRREGDKIVGEASYGDAHVGAPGLLHGGLISLLLDEVIGHVAIAQGAGVVTHSLSVRYRRPTPLRTPLRVEGWFDRQEGNRWYAHGRILVGEEVTAEAEGIFAEISGERFDKMFAATRD